MLPGSGRVLADHRPGEGDVSRKLGAFAAGVYGRAEDAYAAASGHECAAGGCGIHPGRQAGDDQAAAAGELIAEPCGHLEPVGRGFARSHDGNGRELIHGGQAAPDIEHGGRVVYPGQTPGVCGVPQSQNGDAGALAGVGDFLCAFQALVGEHGDLALAEKVQLLELALGSEICLPGSAQRVYQEDLGPGSQPYEGGEPKPIFEL